MRNTDRMLICIKHVVATISPCLWTNTILPCWVAWHQRKFPLDAIKPKSNIFFESKRAQEAKRFADWDCFNGNPPLDPERSYCRQNSSHGPCFYWFLLVQKWLNSFQLKSRWNYDSCCKFYLFNQAGTSPYSGILLVEVRNLWFFASFLGPRGSLLWPLGSLRVYAQQHHWAGRCVSVWFGPSGHPIIRAGGTWAEGKCKLIPSCVPCHLAWFIEISGQSRARGIFSSTFPFSCLVALAWIYPPPSNSGIFAGRWLGILGWGVDQPWYVKVVRSLLPSQFGPWWELDVTLLARQDRIEKVGWVAWQMDFLWWNKFLPLKFVILLPVNHGSM